MVEFDLVARHGSPPRGVLARTRLRHELVLADEARPLADQEITGRAGAGSHDIDEARALADREITRAD
jgi:hypothetical protein